MLGYQHAAVSNFLPECGPSAFLSETFVKVWPLLNELPVTALVVGRNERRLLRDCLSSLSFCSELIYADMDSSDDSKEVALELNARIIDVDPHPFADPIRQQLLSHAKHSWILFLDPDERINHELAQYLVAEWKQISSGNQIGALKLPFFYYAFGRKLKGTVWGGEKPLTRLVHRERFVFSELVHTEGQLFSDSFRSEIVDGGGGREVQHMWLTDVRVFFRKHQRYVTAEGPDRFAKGFRTSLWRVSWTFPREFLICFIKRRGYRDRMIGFLLSIFWAGYQFASEVGLLREQRRREKFV